MVAPTALEVVYAGASLALSLAGLSMVGLATHAYVTTDREEMLSLAIGFALVVAAAIATTASAFLGGFDNTLQLLVVHNAIATAGYAFIIYSVVGR
ncbi:MAG: hypothetical protein ABEJ67_06600 [Halanaeroarchaeum sp.]